MTPEEKLELEKRKLAAALKELRVKPDALVFLSTECFHMDFDVPNEIDGIPVYATYTLLNRVMNGAYHSRNVPWVPVWSEGKNGGYIEHIRDFNETYQGL